jgi:hypothetical protein
VPECDGLTIVSEEASLSSRQYSLLHLTHLRINSSLQLMHCSSSVHLSDMGKAEHLTYRVAATKAIASNANYLRVIMSAWFLIQDGAHTLGALRPGQISRVAIQEQDPRPAVETGVRNPTTW